jgi:twitching motility protein PilT
MPLVDSLLTAIVRSDGDALVLHVGEKPYVVAVGGPVELSRQGLGLGAMEGMLAQLLSADALRTLREMGAVEHEIEQRTASSGDRFTVVAARGGDDIWIELRRHRRLAEPAPVVEVPHPMDADPVSVQSAGSPDGAAVTVDHAAVASATDIAPVAPVPVEPVRVEAPVDRPPPAVVSAGAGAEAHEPAAPVTAPDPVAETVTAAVATPDARSSAQEAEDLGAARLDIASEPTLSLPPMPVGDLAAVATASPDDRMPVASATDQPTFAPARQDTAQGHDADHASLETIAHEIEVAPAGFDDFASDPFFAPQPVMLAPSSSENPMVTEAPKSSPPASGLEAPVVAAPAVVPPPVVAAPEPQVPAAAELQAPAAAEIRVGEDPLPAVVLSLNRDGLRNNGSTTRGPVRLGGIERLLRVAAARGASALYLTTQARPAVRVDGDIRLLDGEPALSSGDVEAAVLELAPEGARDKESAEWIRDLDDVGRVRITTFRDYRGPGAILRMIQARPTSADQLGLVREIQALASEPEGLVIVTGPRASGKSTLVSAFVDLINRQRNDHLITLEGQIRFVHESRGSLVSQREVRGSAAEVVAEARAALRENPDVLVIEDLRSPDVLQAALDAAGSGLLVFASVTAASATAALERLVDLCPSEQRRTVRAALAEHLRGVVAQVLLRKAGGGRLAARELVLNTSAVAALIGDGQIAQLPRAIDSGRKVGMAPLNDALVAFVQSGAVDVREAYRKADDKPGFLALLRREGIDTSFVERLA